MINKYLLDIFNKEFIPMFFVLFSIMSIIVTVDIANASSVIEISFLDFFRLYSYQIPSMILYVFPILFFVSMATSIKKSCLQSEMIVMFSLGLKPFRMFKIYFIYAFLSSIFLIIIAIGMMPLSEYLNKKFIHEKKTTQSINLSKSDFGQKFGNWFLFINKENDVFKNIILFNKSKDSEIIVVADEVDIGDSNKSFELKLENGKAYISTEQDLMQVEYKEMSVYDSIIIGKLDYNTLLEYWQLQSTEKDTKKKLVLGINIALFPLMALYAIFGISFLKPRISKDKVGLYSFYYIASFVFSVHYLLAYIGLWTIIVNPILFSCISYIIYYIRVK